MEGLHAQWNAFEYEQKKHGTNWFWTVGTIAVASAVASIILGNVLLSLLIIVGTIALLLQSVKKPKKVQFIVSEQGIHIGDKLYQYKHLESFSITEEHILIKSEKRICIQLYTVFFIRSEGNLILKQCCVGLKVLIKTK